ncbi:hypothetical protein [Solirubrobacter deserti]|uniref:MFS transporter n=1 Tax=Solirubrobacter deserti TaxID=2282478 RepID=A0ABT4RPP8_9ACTN|nr:hypothetical protein [Solirubrobacter deserti]MDA0140383.1 hypothetical protein [Solirubrobacter deserti]
MVALAVLVDSLGAGAWVLGLVCSIGTLTLVSVLPAATTRRSADRRYRAAPSRR